MFAENVDANSVVTVWTGLIGAIGMAASGVIGVGLGRWFDGTKQLKQAEADIETAKHRTTIDEYKQLLNDIQARSTLQAHQIDELQRNSLYISYAFAELRLGEAELWSHCNELHGIIKRAGITTEPIPPMPKRREIKFPDPEFLARQQQTTSSLAGEVAQRAGRLPPDQGGDK